MRGHPSSEGPPGPNQSGQNEHLSMLGKGEALCPQRLLEEMISLCLMLCEGVGLRAAIVGVIMLLPEGDKASV